DQNNNVEEQDEKREVKYDRKSTDALLPLSVLQYTKSVQDPCKNLEKSLMKMRKIFNFHNFEKQAVQRRELLKRLNYVISESL
ncbi:hypothetical protein PENTCL1PPCAC_8033, partial [Pristionchus entomophagus]